MKTYIPFIIALVGIMGYMINLRIIDHYIRLKTYQMAEEGKVERRRSSENREIKSKAEQRLMKEVPKLKWTVWFGTSMLLVGAVGVVWVFINMLTAIF